MDVHAHERFAQPRPGAALADAVSTPAFPRTVLVVDDEPAVRDVARLALERFGFRTLGAADGIEALELFRNRSSEIDAVLLDMTMPTLDGIATLRALRELQPDVRVLLTSGYPEPDADERLGVERPSGFIQKPFRPAELVAMVRALLA